MSKYNDVTAVMQVIGCVYNNPTLLDYTDKYIITDEDFADYVGDFMSVREDTFTFTRSEKTGKGRSKVTSKYYLEG
jgi:hypothetical protein